MSSMATSTGLPLAPVLASSAHIRNCRNLLSDKDWAIQDLNL